MHPTKERRVYSTNIAYYRDATVCSYVLLSSMHMSEEVAKTLSAKPQIINHFENKQKGEFDTMNKMLGEYTVRKHTLRWPLIFFYNMIDVTGWACYIIYR